jgi:hypothetical protein
VPYYLENKPQWLSAFATRLIFPNNTVILEKIPHLPKSKGDGELERDIMVSD